MNPDEAAIVIARAIHAIQNMQGTGVIDLPALLRLLKGQP
jgi:hypothetical protein